MPGPAQLGLAPPPHLPARPHLPHPCGGGRGVERGHGRALGQRVQQRARSGERQVRAGGADPGDQRLPDPLLAVEDGQSEGRVPGEPGHRQHPAGVGDADADGVDGEGDQRRDQRLEVGGMLGVEREDLRAAPGLLDRGDDLDDVVHAHAALVEGHQHAADGVVHGGPLDAVEALELAAQRASHRGAARDRRRGQLQVRPPAGHPHAPAAPRRRGLEHRLPGLGEPFQVAVGGVVDAGDHRAGGPGAGLGQHRGGVRGGLGDRARGRARVPDGRRDEGSGERGGARGEADPGRRDMEGRSRREAGESAGSGQSHELLLPRSSTGGCAPDLTP